MLRLRPIDGRPLGETHQMHRGRLREVASGCPRREALVASRLNLDPVTGLARRSHAKTLKCLFDIAVACRIDIVGLPQLTNALPTIGKSLQVLFAPIQLIKKFAIGSISCFLEVIEDHVCGLLRVVNVDWVGRQWRVARFAHAIAAGPRARH